MIEAFQHHYLYIAPSLLEIRAEMLVNGEGFLEMAEVMT